MLKQLARATKRGSANSLALSAATAVSKAQTDDESKDAEPDANAEDTGEEEAAAAEDTTDDDTDSSSAAAEDTTDDDTDNEDKESAGATASAVNSETTRVLAIVGSPQGLANPEMAVELAKPDDEGQRLSADRALSLLEKSGTAAKGSKLAAKVSNHENGLGADTNGGQPLSTSDRRAAARDARKQRQQEASRE